MKARICATMLSLAAIQLLHAENISQFHQVTDFLRNKRNIQITENKLKISTQAYFEKRKNCKILSIGQAPAGDMVSVNWYCDKNLWNKKVDIFEFKNGKLISMKSDASVVASVK